MRPLRNYQKVRNLQKKIETPQKRKGGLLFIPEIISKTRSEFFGTAGDNEQLGSIVSHDP